MPRALRYSGFAIAGIISQQAGEVREATDSLSNRTESAAKDIRHPVAFLLRSMSLDKRNYTVDDQEMPAIVKSGKHWQHYLEGARHPVEVLTHHHNLQRFMTTKLLTG
jgi:hypothetical protein